MQRLSLRFIAALATASFAAVLQPTPALSMTPAEAQQVQALTARMTTRCIGRYLIDLPEAFVLNSESRAEVEGVKFDIEPMSKAAFETSLQRRREMLESKRQPGKDRDRPHLRNTLPLNEGAVFDRAESDATSDRSARTLELRSWQRGFQVRASINATDLTFPEDKDDALAKQLRTDVQEKLTHLLSVYDRIRGRRDDEIPTGPGLCIPNGFVLGPQREGQMVGFVYHLRDSRDVFFTASAYDAIKESTTLLQRTSPQEREMAARGHTVLRKGKRQIHGEEYEEFLPQGPADDGVLGVTFYLHGNELRKQAQQPFFIFSLDTGSAIPRPDMDLNEKDRLGLFKPLTQAGLSPEQALQLWDAVAPTIRQRPGSF